MKKKICSFLIILLILTAMPLYFGTGALSVYADADNANEYRIAHYNILGTSGTNRTDVVTDLKGFEPDLISLNEVNQHTYDDLMKKFEDLGYSHYANSDWSEYSQEFQKIKAGWYNVTLFKSEKFKLIDSGMFTLSDKPNDDHSFISYMDISSKNNKEGRPRTCSWVYLKNIETGGKFIFSSVHAQHAKSNEYDYNSIGFTVLGEQLALLKQKYNCEVICAGDLNSSNPDEVFDFGFKTANPGTSTHRGGGAIDSVLYSSEISLNSFNVGTPSKSDHYPVFVSVNVPKNTSLSDMQIILTVIIVAATILITLTTLTIIIKVKKKKEKNRKAAEMRLAEMRAKLAEYEAKKLNET